MSVVTGAQHFEIEGAFHDGSTSRQITAVLYISSKGLELRYDGLALSPPVAELSISQRLGNTPRTLTMGAYGSFVTTDNASVDAAIKVLGPDLCSDSRSSALIHSFESRWHNVLACLVLLVAGSGAGFVWGIPAASKAIAFTLPQNTTESLGDLSLSLVERILNGESTLPEARQAALRAQFEADQRGHAPDERVDILFRDGGSIGANALALPNGTIIFTDQLVQLAENDAELRAIFAHELGHIAERHSLRQIIQSSFISVAAALYVGDLSNGASLLAALPAWLANMSYSRELEAEADTYAYEFMTANGLPTHHFSDILLRLTDEGVEASDAEPPTRDYLSSHPATSERIQRFE